VISKNPSVFSAEKAGNPPPLEKKGGAFEYSFLRNLDAEIISGKLKG